MFEEPTKLFFILKDHILEFWDYPRTSLLCTLIAFGWSHLIIIEINLKFSIIIILKLSSLIVTSYIRYKAFSSCWNDLHNEITHLMCNSEWDAKGVAISWRFLLFGCLWINSWRHLSILSCALFSTVGSTLKFSDV